MADATTQSTFEQIKALVKPIGEEGVAMMAYIDLASRRLFNRPFKTLADEADAMGNSLTIANVSALIRAGKFEAARATPTDAEMPATIQP